MIFAHGYVADTEPLQIPDVVTMQTTADPIVPYRHEPVYRWKTLVSGSGTMHCNLPVFEYGHCAFTAEETVTAFALLAYKVGLQGP